MCTVSSFLLAVVLTAAGPVGSISGQVFDRTTRTGLAGANVVVVGTELGVSADEAGRFLIRNVPVGIYTVEASMMGYQTQARTNVVVQPGYTSELAFGLAQEAIALSAVTVKADYFSKVRDAPVSERNFGADEIKVAPGGLGDIQRVVQAMPAVVSSGDQDNEVVVRGGNPGENLFLLDGIELPYPNHFGSFTAQGGAISMLNSLLIREVDFIAGAFPARYGNRASSVMDISLRRGSTQELDGNVDMGMAGLGVVAEFPLPGKHNSFLGSYHKSFLELMAKAGVWGMSAVPYYDDALGKATIRLHRAHELSLLGLWGKDYIFIEPGQGMTRETYTVAQTTSRLVAGVTWQALYGDRGFGRLLLFGNDNVWNGFAYESTDVADTLMFNRSREASMGMKYDLSYRFRPRHEIQAGVGLNRSPADFFYRLKPLPVYRYIYNPDSTVRDSVPLLDSLGNPVVWKFDCEGAGASWNTNGYVQHRVQLGDLGGLTVGLRFDRFGYTGYTALAPRLGFSTRPLVAGISFHAGWGWHYQPPAWYILFWDSAANRNLPDRRSDHYIAGLERVLGEDVKLSLELYLKSNLRLPIPYSWLTPDTYDYPVRYVPAGRGGAAGLELFLQKKQAANWHGSIAYSLSRNWRNDPLDNARKIPGDYDHRHVLTLSGTYIMEFYRQEWYQRLPGWFRATLGGFFLSDEAGLGLRFRYMSGRPFTPPVWNPEIRRWVAASELRNTERYPDYHRLDLRWDHKFVFPRWSLSWYFEVQNIYNRKNIWGYRYVDGTGERQELSGLAFWPIAGLVVQF